MLDIRNQLGKDMKLMQTQNRGEIQSLQDQYRKKMHVILMWVDFRIAHFRGFTFVYDFWIRKYGDKLKEDCH